MYGYYSAVSLHHNNKYHAMRDGVNQEAIYVVLAGEGFECEVLMYCSFPMMLGKPLGEIGFGQSFWLACNQRMRHVTCDGQLGEVE